MPFLWPSTGKIYWFRLSSSNSPKIRFESTFLAFFHQRSSFSIESNRKTNMCSVWCWRIGRYTRSDSIVNGMRKRTKRCEGFRLLLERVSRCCEVFFNGKNNNIFRSNPFSTCFWTCFVLAFTVTHPTIFQVYSIFLRFRAPVIIAVNMLLLIWNESIDFDHMVRVGPVILVFEVRICSIRWFFNGDRMCGPSHLNGSNYMPGL